MGGGFWDDKTYDAMKGAGGHKSFAHTSRVSAGSAPALHPDMDVKGKVRESRDNAEHPESLAIQVLFDVTGSMSSVPMALQRKLGSLMELVIRKGYVEHPQILFGAIGDATCDSAPLQIGQFESDIKMHEDLTKIYLEGGGGGQKTESYELAIYFAARHTSIDCYEKRGKKGFLFIIGDEMPYDVVKRAEVERHFGDKLQENISVEDIIAEAKEKYHLFYIIPVATSNGKDMQIRRKWQELLGEENMLILQDAEEAAELIAATIGITEGKDLDDVTKDITVVTSGKAAKNVAISLERYAGTATAKSGGLAKADNLPPSKGPGAKRL